MVQFKEHETGTRQTDPRIQKLDKLARLLKVHMQVDGVSYGLIPETKPTNVAVTETVKKVFTVDTSDLQVEEANQFVEDIKPVVDTVEETTETVDEKPVEKPTKTTTTKPTKTTASKSTKSTKSTKTT